jgi:hypothetical protein
MPFAYNPLHLIREDRFHMRPHAPGAGRLATRAARRPGMGLLPSVTAQMNNRYLVFARLVAEPLLLFGLVLLGTTVGDPLGNYVYDKAFEVTPYRTDAPQPYAIYQMALIIAFGGLGGGVLAGIYGRFLPPPRRAIYLTACYLLLVAVFVTWHIRMYGAFPLSRWFWAGYVGSLLAGAALGLVPLKYLLWKRR